MPFGQWKEEMSVGVAALDAEHKRLYELFHDLYDAIIGHHELDVIEKIIDGLVIYTLTHFKNEEELFVKTAYPEAENHKREHRDLAHRVEDLRLSNKTTPPADMAREIFGFMQFWLARHIMETDKKYTAHLNANGVS